MGSSDEFADRWRRSFETFDVNKSGCIDSEELKKLMQVCQLNPSQSDVDELMEKFDENESGTLGEDEFVQLMHYFLEQGHPDPYQQLEESFQFFDEEGTQRIPIDRMLEIVQSLGEPLSEAEKEDFLADLQAIDNDNSGTIEMSEFIQLICNQEDIYRKQPPPPPPPVPEDEEGDEERRPGAFVHEEDPIEVTEEAPPMSGTPPPPPAPED
ncbi:troponin C-like [Symsagittifera roscoffensis]|uniref:troponin C-like n=1 Tax=Symsagittifera roscoffensis TaxID=84072 RepID=UPI00307B7FEA